MAFTCKLGLRRECDGCGLCRENEICYCDRCGKPVSDYYRNACGEVLCEDCLREYFKEDEYEI